MKKIGILTLLSASLAMPVFASDALSKAINGEHRSEQNKQRDQFRNPEKTLTFFGFKPDMTVVEIWPGGGWYTEILAPALKEKGTYIAANFDPDAGVNYYNRRLEEFENKFAGNPEVYGEVKSTVFAPPAKVAVAPKGSADMVLTFRNVHNWYMRGEEKAIAAAFSGFYDALKPGGILGVVEHRLPKGMDLEMQKKSGYMSEALVIKWAEQAGFKLVAKSDINANPKDTADHPKGVWTLPPSLRLGDEDKEKYLAIGESDRMTLKFMKPKQ